MRREKELAISGAVQLIEERRDKPDEQQFCRKVQNNNHLG